jgi:hypothetical protein
MASVLDRVARNKGCVMVLRNGKRMVALVPADDLEGPRETVYLVAVTQKCKAPAGRFVACHGMSGSWQKLLVGSPAEWSCKGSFDSAQDDS